jgi:hypothetical protein
MDCGHLCDVASLGLPQHWPFCLFHGAATCMEGLSHSTAPSFASRVRRSAKLTTILSEDKGETLPMSLVLCLKAAAPSVLRTEIILPDWNNF